MLPRMLLPLAQSLAHLVAPPVCALCLGEGQKLDGIWGLDLCRWCEAACSPLPAACPRCGEPGAPRECDRCRSHPPPFDATFCLFRYEDPADLLVTNLKFRGELACARVLGMLFARRYAESGRALPQCLVPVPLHAARHRDRGFNQCAEIARHLAPRLRGASGRPLLVGTRLLQRTRATGAQSGLAAGDRAANLRGAFLARRDMAMPPHVALLDDVMTTGHTAAAAAQALKDAGCRRVDIWACARAVKH
jgi:ComF family protein